MQPSGEGSVDALRRDFYADDVRYQVPPGLARLGGLRRWASAAMRRPLPGNHRRTDDGGHLDLD